MNEKNFNSISQFEVPKSWIDSALDVPATHAKNPFPLLKFTRTLAAVACFILVCGISVALYFITDDSSIPPVKDPVVSDSQFVDDSYYKSESDSNSSQKNENSNESSNTNSALNPTSSGLDSQVNEDKTENGSGSHPEPNEKPQKPTQNDGNKPEKPDSTQPSEEVDIPTEPEKPTDTPTPKPPDEDFTEPTELPPPVDPTVKPSVIPTENPSEPEFDPPWVNPTEEPTTPDKPNYNTMILVLIGENRVAAAKTIYCALYDSSGNLIGDSNLYSSSHIAQKGTTSGGRTEVYYYPYHNINIPKSGTYTYVFYNDKGEQMIRNTCYLLSNI